MKKKLIQETQQTYFLKVLLLLDSKASKKMLLLIEINLQADKLLKKVQKEVLKMEEIY